MIMRKWANHEQQRLVRLYNDGLPTAEIARRLNRTQWAVERRASDLRKQGVEIDFASHVKPGSPLYPA